MEQMTKRTEIMNTTMEGNTARRIVGVIVGVIEVVLAFRLIFKLLGANPNNQFVQIIYNITQFLVGMFEGIFSRVTASGAQTKAFFDPATLIAMVVIAIIAGFIMKLITPRNGTSVERAEFIDNNQKK